MERRLAAVLAADVVGYSRLMRADEEGTLLALRALHNDLIGPKIAEHRGRIFKIMGDGFLVEFSSVVDAVACAAETQKTMAMQNAGEPEAARINLRMGINLGDIIVDGDDIQGDGVNVAARLEALSEPGAICVSDGVYELVRDRLDLSFEDLGEREVKNIDRPVRVRMWTSTDASTTVKQRVEAKSPLVSDKPSIAVLPFDNMSGDPEQEYFSDGITEDVITELARFKNLFVIARNSTFAFKGQATDMTEVGARLGVAYLVEGSVRKSGNRVRVTSQLIEAKTGNHLWAERYDRDLEDIFDVQDELVHEIASAVPGQLHAASAQRARRRAIANLNAYDCMLRGEWLVNQDFGSHEAIALFEKAIELDPQCARAYTNLASCHAYSIFAQGKDVYEAAEAARSLAERALDIDSADPAIQATVAATYILVGQHDLARQHIETAMRLNPNDYVVMNFFGIVMGYLGDHKKGLIWKDRVCQHDPLSGDSHREGYFDLFYMERRYDDAIALFRGWRNPPVHMYLELAAAHAQLHQMNDLREAITKFESIKPKGFEPSRAIDAHIRMCASSEDKNNWIEGYRKAGFDADQTRPSRRDGVRDDARTDVQRTS